MDNFDITSFNFMEGLVMRKVLLLVLPMLNSTSDISTIRGFEDD